MAVWGILWKARLWQTKAEQGTARYSHVQCWKDPSCASGTLRISYWYWEVTIWWPVGEIMGKSWENFGEMLGKSWWNLGKSRRNLGEFSGKSHRNLGKISGKCRGNVEGIMEESAVDNYMEHVWDNNCGILSTIDSNVWCHFCPCVYCRKLKRGGSSAKATFFQSDQLLFKIVVKGESYLNLPGINFGIGKNQ